MRNIIAENGQTEADNAIELRDLQRRIRARIAPEATP
jgi:hypothetical protein